MTQTITIALLMKTHFKGIVMTSSFYQVERDFEITKNEF